MTPVNDVRAEDMADDSSAQKVDPSLVAEIVSSYVAQNSIGVDQLAGLIATVHRTLSGLGTTAPAPWALICGSASTWRNCENLILSKLLS